MEKTLEVAMGLPSLFSSTYSTRGLAARQLFRVPPCRKSTIHLQTSMSSPGLEPGPYGTTRRVDASHNLLSYALYKSRTN
ncbi:hypothetical protein TNCV_1407331 [Trichonephila clavipes]|nr:hypothetical protein TNCV_1407331 [Trichonephila clavipes]